MFFTSSQCPRSQLTLNRGKKIGASMSTMLTVPATAARGRIEQTSSAV